jgi:hypothetical protein
MTAVPITTNKECLLDFTHTIKLFLTDYIDKHPQSEDIEWLSTWYKLRDSGFGSIKFARSNLATRVLGHQAKDKSISSIILGLRQTFPIIDETYVFIPDTEDTDLWQMYLKSEHLNENTDHNNDDTEDDIQAPKAVPQTYSNVSSEITHGENPWMTVAGQFKPITNPVTESVNTEDSNTNHFQALENATDMIEELDVDVKEEDDDGLSYDKSEQHILEQVSNSDNSASTNLSTTTSNFNNDLPLTTRITIKKINKLRSEGKNISENASMNEILLWIETTSNSMHNSHKQHVAEMNKQRSLQQQAANQCTSTCVGMTEKFKRTKDNFKNAVSKIEEDAISTVNKISNRRVQEINTNLNEAKTTLSKIEKAKAIPIDVLKQVDNSTKLLNDNIENIFNTYEESIGNIIDNEKESLKTWLNQIMANNDTFRSIRDLTAETAKLKASRILLDSKRQEIDEWFEKTKKNYTKMQTKLPIENISVNDLSSTPLPPFQPDTPIKYVKDIYQVYGYIMQNKKYENGKWYFEIFTMNGTTIHDCCEDNITIIQDSIPPTATTTRQSPIRSSDLCQSTNQPLSPPQTPPSRSYSSRPQPQHEIKREMSNENMNTTWRPHGHHTRRLAQNEFQYPIGAYPMSVNQTYLIKHAEKWDFDLTSVLDLRGFYDTLVNHFRQYNIYLKDYVNITKDTSLSLIQEDNCINHDVATKQMSQAIMVMFQTYGKDIFKNYTDPLDYISAFKANGNGLGYLKRIMKKRHPNLKDITNRKAPPAPAFKSFPNIHIFIQAYIEWLHDESLRGDRNWSEKEKLDHVLESLDERFQIALSKIDTMLIRLYADPTAPQKLPPQLRVTNELGMYITDLIPDEQKEDLSNRVPKIMAVSTRSQGYKKRLKSPKDKYRFRQQPAGENEKDTTKHQDHVDMDTFKWEILPGQTCPACKKNNHNVYKTGCPALATFANCQAFFDSKPRSLIEKVQRSFNQYQKALGKKMMERRNKDRRLLRTVAATTSENDFGALKIAMFQDYKNDYMEEQYNQENPYNDFYFDEITSDTESSSSESDNQ